MGLLTGLLAGITFTTFSLYLPLALHQRTRAHQSLILHQQTLLLTSLVDPAARSRSSRNSSIYRYSYGYDNSHSSWEYDDGEEATRPRYRLQRGSWVERWKDEWNGQVEGAVRWVQGVRWGELRDGVEGRWREGRGGEKRV